MSLISSTIPNLANGVSQQPFALRLPSQAERQVNCFSSVVNGLRKRPGLKHVAKIIDGAVDSSAYIHTINRDPTEQYIVVITDGSIRVFDLDGTERTVNAPNGLSYLASTNPRADFSVMTVADFSFIVNKTIKVDKLTGSESPSRQPEALVYVRQGNYARDYKISIDGQERAALRTPDGGAAQQGYWIGTDRIADALVNGIGGYPQGEQDWLTQGNGGSTGKLTDVAGFTFTLKGSVIHITKDDGGDFTVTTKDDYGGDAMLSFKGSVQRFSNLPATSVPDGFKLEVVGDSSSSFDNYYVTYSETATDGVWEESTAEGILTEFNGSTMPHLLVRESDGTFTFRGDPWTARKVGDEDSAPWPSFTDRTITDVFFYRNRLGFISDENVIMSRAGDFFNFWPTTVTTVLDSDPIDVAVSHTKVSILRHAVPFNRQLLLFSDQTQFILEADQLLTPQTVAINQTTEFASSLLAKPVGAGSNIYFAFDRGQWAGVREFFVSDNTETETASDITSHVPEYIPSEIKKIASVTNEDLLCVLSNADNAKNKIFPYKYYFDVNGEKLQSSWSIWEFEDCEEILDIDFLESDLYVLMKQHDGLYLNKIRIENGSTEPNYPHHVHLDRKVHNDEIVAKTYFSDQGTHIALPYEYSETNVPNGQATEYVAIVRDDVITTGGVSWESGTVIPLKGVGNKSTLLAPDVDLETIPLIVGREFWMDYEMSTIVLKEDAVGGGQSAINEGRLQLRKVTLTYAETGYFEVKVTPKARDPYRYYFTGRILGSAQNLLGGNQLEDGSFQFPVVCNNLNTKIEFGSKSFRPVAIMSAEWEAYYHRRSRRL